MQFMKHFKNINKSKKHKTIKLNQINLQPTN